MITKMTCVQEALSTEWAVVWPAGIIWAAMCPPTHGYERRVQPCPPLQQTPPLRHHQQPIHSIVSYISQSPIYALALHSTLESKDKKRKQYIGYNLYISQNNQWTMKSVLVFIFYTGDPTLSTIIKLSIYNCLHQHSISYYTNIVLYIFH